MPLQAGNGRGIQQVDEGRLLPAGSGAHLGQQLPVTRPQTGQLDACDLAIGPALNRRDSARVPKGGKWSSF